MCILWCEGKDFFFAPFVENIIFSSLSCLVTVVKNQLGLRVLVHIWTSNSVLLIYRSVFSPIPICVDYRSFIVRLESRSCKSSNLVLLFQNCFCYSRSFAFPNSFKIILAISTLKKKASRDCDWIKTVDHFRENWHLNSIVFWCMNVTYCPIY